MASDKNMQFEFYKLITGEDEEGIWPVDEFGWISDNEFCVWISYCLLSDFMGKLKAVFGNGIFDDGVFNANMQEYGVCIDLTDILSGSIDIEEVFPKDKYKH